MFKNLRDFLQFLEKNNQLKEINYPISTELEITEISRRYLKQDGPALLFTNVIKSDGIKSEYPVLTNLYASTNRIAAALGLQGSDDLRKLGELLAFLRAPKIPSSFKNMFTMLPIAKRILAMQPKVIKKAKSQEIVINDPDINILPIQKCWPDDVSPLITWSIVVTKEISEDHHETHNLGIYRLQPIARNKVIVRWLKMRGGAAHLQKWKEKYKNNIPYDGSSNMPIAVIIGANPAITMAAVMPIPSDISEYSFAGLLQNRCVELVKCKTIDLKVPADAEIIIEGTIDLQETAPEGPFGDHTGYYNDVEEFPVMTISAITMKKNAIYLSTYTGKPPDEPSIIGCAMNEIFIPIIKQQFPEIVDFYLPQEGCSYRFAIISIKKTYPGQAKRVMMGTWSYLKQFMYTKFIVIVDDDINIRNWNDVIWAISTRADPKRDSIFIENSPIDYLDFASPESGLGSKIGIDATNKMPPETHRNWGAKIEMNKSVIDRIDELWEKIQKNEIKK